MFAKRRKREPGSDAKTQDDLLAQSEEAEFEASVLAARLRAESRTAPCPVAPQPKDEAEVEWEDLSDVYRPVQGDVRDALRMLGCVATAVRSGESIVVIHRAALDRLNGHLRSDTNREMGGLLTGKVLFDGRLNLFLIEVEQALPALGGDGTPISFSYTSESWEAMLPGMLQMAAESTVVGSYHSHPGLGVFLSPVDRATQTDVFPHDWQIAVVADPIDDTIGFFIGELGRRCRWTVCDG